MQYKSYYESPVGRLLLASDGESLTGLWIENQKYYGAGLSDTAVEEDDLPVFETAKGWLKRYFAGEEPAICELSLALSGSDFRRKVLDELCKIPYGQTTTYGEIAKKIGSAAQPVGGAIGHNPICVIIPCHRVVGTDGSLTGYAGGLDTKIKLLELEKVDMSKFYRPKKGSTLQNKVDKIKK